MMQEKNYLQVDSMIRMLHLKLKKTPATLHCGPLMYWKLEFAAFGRSIKFVTIFNLKTDLNDITVEFLLYSAFCLNIENCFSNGLSMSRPVNKNFSPFPLSCAANNFSSFIVYHMPLKLGGRVGFLLEFTVFN